MAGRHLSEELIEGGAALLATTDALSMQAQGAMWVYDYALEDWRYYLVTSLVDTLGRRKTYKLLIDAFERLALPKSMIVDDVHLGSPSDEFFKLVSRVALVSDGGRATFQNCRINDMPFDGVIFRTVQGAPTDVQARSIERRFSKRVRDLVAA